MLLGIPLAIAARAGRWPKRSVVALARPVAILLLVCAIGALLAGVIGHQFAAAGKVWLLEPMFSQVPKERHVAFLTDLWAHSASYLIGLLGGLVLAVTVFVGRLRQDAGVHRRKG